MSTHTTACCLSLGLSQHTAALHVHVGVCSCLHDPVVTLQGFTACIGALTEGGTLKILANKAVLDWLGVLCVSRCTQVMNSRIQYNTM